MANRVKDVLAVLEPLIEQIDPADVLTSTDQDYSLHSQPFSAGLDLRPAVVLAPSSTDALAKIMGFVYKTNLDFVIRGHGAQSPSASDVIISTLKFNGFEYDAVKKLATIGVGSTWVQVAGKMRDVDPSYSIAVARTAGVGVGGSILHGGLSWLTSEFGMISDPLNLIDAEVVKYDGTVVMAANEPDLMWALRGSGGGFGVMTRVILRAHLYPTDIWSGMILIPRKHLREVARQTAIFTAKPQHPRTCALLYSLQKNLLSTFLEEEDLKVVSGDMLALHVYDACGEAHGREAFDWALKFPGAIDRTTVTDTKGIVDMQQNLDKMRGSLRRLFAVPIPLSTVDENTIVQAIEWQDEVATIDSNIHKCSILAIQCFALRTPIGCAPSDVAWPRRVDDKHYILLVTGAPVDGSDEQDAKARQVAIDTPNRILGPSRNCLILPTAHEEWRDPKHMYREHWGKLAELRKRYDPDLKFRAIVNP